MPAKNMLVIELILVWISAWFLTNLYRKWAFHFKLIDVPNSRSLHNTVVPRGAGIVFALIGISGAFVLYGCGDISVNELGLFGILAAFMMFIGFLDDRFSVSSYRRLFLQILLSLSGACMLYGSSFVTASMVGALMLMTVLLVFTVNTFNFMDGMDGIAALQALSVFGFLAGFAWYQEAYGFAVLMAIIFAAVLGFFSWNKPPAQVFMGDAGSYYLGWSIGAALLFSVLHLSLRWESAVLLYLIFTFDTTLTLIRRAKAGESVFTAHKKHAYQRLVQSGWSHAKVLTHFALVQSIMLLLAASSSVMAHTTEWLLFIGVGLASVLYGMTERISPMK